MTNEKLLHRACVHAATRRRRPGPLTVDDVVAYARRHAIAPATLVGFAFDRGWLPDVAHLTIHELLAEIARIEAGVG